MVARRNSRSVEIAADERLVRRAYVSARRRVARCTCTDLVQAALLVSRARSELPDSVGEAQTLEPLHRLGGSISQRVQGLGS